MRSTLTLALAALLMAAADEKKRVIHFTKDDTGKVPAGWTAAKTGMGEGSNWKVVADASAPSGSGFVLAQTAAGPSALFNLCILNEGRYRDVELIVSFKANRGELDQGGGLVWRYQDAKNYYVARMNPLEDNFRVYKVEDGKRKQLETKEGLKAPAGQWHMLKVKMTGDRIECFLNGQKQLDTKDDTFKNPGQVGLWTKADAQTFFDDLRISGQ